MWIVPKQHSVSSLVLAGLMLDLSEHYPVWKPWLMLSGTATQRPFSWRRWETRPWIWRLYGSETFRTLTLPHFSEWTSCTADSLARTYQSPGSEPESTASEVDYGESSTASFEQHGHGSSLSRTCPVYSQFELFSTEPISRGTSLRFGPPRELRGSVGTLKPVWHDYTGDFSRYTGYLFCSMSVANWKSWVIVFRQSRLRRQMLARPTRGSGCLSSQWTTPQAHDEHPGNPSRVGRYGTKHGAANLADDVMLWQMQNTDLGQAVAQWPTQMWATPTAVRSDTSPNANRGADLREQVRDFHLSLPGRETPDHGNTSSTDGRNSRRQWTTPRTGKHGTPIEGKRHGIQPQGMSLNPRFVAWLQGFPVNWTCVCQRK